MYDIKLEIVDMPEQEKENEGGLQFDILDPREQEFGPGGAVNFFEDAPFDHGFSGFIKLAHERGIYKIGDLVDNSEKLIDEYTHEKHLLQHHIDHLHKIIDQYRELLETK